jgi:hypothetical protein
MTDDDFLAWLKSSSAIRTTLVEVDVRSGGVEITRYLAVRGYTTKPSDTPANTVYLGILKPTFEYTEELSLDSDGRLSAGQVEIYNPDGRRDSWLQDIWKNRPLRAYIGDPRWPRADFRLIFDGIVDDISSPARDTLALALRDKLQRLNTPLIETKLGGTTENKDNVLPGALGEVHNVSPLLTDPTTLEYQIHNVANENVIEVRDNGLPVSITKFASTGKFRLNQQSFGAVTASVQGDKGDGTYRNTIAALVRRVVTAYGKSSDAFVTGDLDTTNLDAFEAAHTQPVGMWCPDRVNVLEVCQKLASSIGAQLVMSRLGKLRILQIDLASLSSPVVLSEKHMIEHSLRIRERTKVRAAVKLGFCKNWTVQTELLTTMPQAHKDLFAREWLESVKSDSTVKTNYKLNTEPEMEETMLLRRVDADVEAQRRLDLWKVQRTVYEFEGIAELLMTLELGMAATIYSTRFGLSGGATGMVVSLRPNWQTGRVTVGVLV